MDLAAIEEFCYVVRSDLDHRLLNDLLAAETTCDPQLAEADRA
jgi:hypothetical protein